MKRLFRAFALPAATALAVAAMPGMAQAATEGTTFTSHGRFADAYFSTLPAEPKIGVIYVDVFVGGGQSASSESGDVLTPYAYVDIYRYRFVSRHRAVTLSERMGSATGAKVDFAAPKRLTDAALVATIRTKTCAGRECAPSGRIQISVAWLGDGPLYRIVTNTRTIAAGTGVYLAHERGAFRAAAATGTVGGRHWTESVNAQLGSDRYGERLRLHQS
jgi:hypothetical protein